MCVCDDIVYLDLVFGASMAEETTLIASAEAIISWFVMSVISDNAVVARLVDLMRYDNRTLVSSTNCILLGCFQALLCRSHDPLGLLICFTTHLIACHGYEALSLLGGCELGFCSIKSIQG